MLKKSIIACLIAVVLAGACLAAVEVKLIQGKRDRGFDYLDIYTTGHVKAKGLLLEDQLLIDFPNSRLAKGLRVSTRYLKKSKRIKAVRVKQIDKKTVRVIVDLKRPIDYDMVNVFGRNKNVIEISDRSDRAAEYQTKWEKKELQAKAPSKKFKPVKFKGVTKGPLLPLKGKTIVLDPGHGGRDPGAITKHGLLEKRLTLAIAKKAATMLRSAGATVYLTRNADQRNSLRDIVAFANKIRPDAFVSIHLNFADQDNIGGTETYYYSRMSRNLALALHKNLISGIKRRDRGLRKAKYFTISRIRVPAVLLEPLYVSNWKESNMASSPQWQIKMAQYIVRGIKEYF